MPRQLTFSELQELKKAFGDLLNYESEDPTDPIDPLTHRQPDWDGCLHIAAMRGDRRSAELLLQAGVDINQQGDMGCTPLHYATKLGNKDVADLLIDHGASTTIRDEFRKLPLESKSYL